MKTMRNATRILLTAAGLLAASAAQAQIQYVTPGKPYTFTATAAEGGGTISYQWFRNGEPISGATDVSYTLPDNLAYGMSVQFTRSAVSDICPHNISYTEPFVVTFCNLLVGATCWAATNVAAPNKFAPRPDMYTPYFQWNRLTAWATDGSSVSGWNTTADESTTWTANPCPAGWRLPTQAEVLALSNTGTTWVVANSSRGNAVAGRFYGPSNGYCTLPDAMTNCIFLPASGYRFSNNGSYDSRSTRGYYWSSTQVSSTNGYNLLFNSADSYPSTVDYNKATGMTLRCVLDVQ